MHDPLQVLAAWDALLAESAKNQPCTEGFRFDFADVTRQALADATTELHARINTAKNKKDKAAFEKYAGAFTDILADIDTVLATRHEFLLGPRLADARAWGTNEAEKNLFEKQARTLITTWDGKAGTILNDYGNRQWSGLVKDFYLPRWEMYFADLKKSIDAGTELNIGEFRKKVTAFETAWADKHADYATAPTGDIREIAPTLRAKYAKLFDEIYADKKPYEGAKNPVGFWKYQANGKTYVRQFNADATITIYENGKATPWMKDFVWTLIGDQIVAERGGTGGQKIIHTFRAQNKIDFTTEGYGEGTRTEKP